MLAAVPRARHRLHYLSASQKLWALRWGTEDLAVHRVVDEALGMIGEAATLDLSPTCTVRRQDFYPAGTPVRAGLSRSS